jgi:hypothetical protein
MTSKDHTHLPFHATQLLFSIFIDGGSSKPNEVTMRFQGIHARVSCLVVSVSVNVAERIR